LKDKWEEKYIAYAKSHKMINQKCLFKISHDETHKACTPAFSTLHWIWVLQDIFTEEEGSSQSRIGLVNRPS